MLVAASALIVCVVLAACGGGEETTGDSGGGSGRAGGTIRVVASTPPDSLDPQGGYTGQSFAADWLVYTPLLTYRHVDGVEGSKLIPGLATALPEVSADGKTYKLTLREGLTYSDGKPVKAADFAYAIQRALKIGWGGKAFFTSHIVGAEQYDAGKAKSISGIVSDDATGEITIKLVEPYGAFPNVLALPSAAPVPTGTPMKNSPVDPPPGVGSYTFGEIDPNRGYTLERNPDFGDVGIDVPTGNADAIEVSYQSNTQTEARMVLDNQADVFDWNDSIPPAIAQEIKREASDRFETQPFASTYYFFLNTQRAPFNDIRARQAVNYAIDRSAFVRLTAGFMKPTCFFLPEGVVGHPDAPCPYGDTPDLEKAKALIKEAGLEGTPVTVWGQEREPRRQYVDYYTDLLNKIGFKATEKIIADDIYFATIGNAKTDPQTGFSDWIQDFPNPSNFYFQMDARTIQPTHNSNNSNVNDPKIQAALKRLNPVAATKLDTVAEDWQELDEYVAEQAYIAPFGTTLAPQFYSNRIDTDSSVFHVLYGTDWSSLRLK